MKRKAVERPFRDPPCVVTWSYPDGHVLTGTVIAATKTRIHRWETPYASRIELIKFDRVKEKHVRFVYARRVRRKWVFASQTTWTFSVAITRAAIREAEKMGLFVRNY
jgi:hypothetical protein